MVLGNSLAWRQSTFWIYEALTGIGLLECHGVVEDSDSMPVLQYAVVYGFLRRIGPTKSVMDTKAEKIRTRIEWSWTF